MSKSDSYAIIYKTLLPDSVQALWVMKELHSFLFLMLTQIPRQLDFHTFLMQWLFLNGSRNLLSQPDESWCLCPIWNGSWCGQNKSTIGVLYLVFQENRYLKTRKYVDLIHNTFPTNYDCLHINVVASLTEHSVLCTYSKTDKKNVLLCAYLERRWGGFV